MLKPVKSPLGVLQKGKPESFLGKEVTSAGRYLQAGVFPRCQVICNESRKGREKKKPNDRAPL